jgi:hypothetical protein
VAILAILGGALLGAPVASSTEAPSTEVWYVMDREGWIRTADARLVLTTYDLRNGPNLGAVPLVFDNWVGEELPITNLETFPTLDAEHLVHRVYRAADGRMIVLSLIGGTKGQSFHHPLICYQWANWPAEDWETTAISLGGSDVILRVIVGRDPEGPAQVDLHWYLWPNDRRDWGDGATQIRVTALAVNGEQQALADARAFARNFFAESRLLDGTLPPPVASADAPPSTGSALPSPLEAPILR